MNKAIFTILFFLQAMLWGGESFETAPASWSRTTLLPGCIYVEHAEVVEEPTIYFDPYGFACYGHALLDGILPLYAMLKKFDLLDAPINLAIKLTAYEISTQAIRNMVQILEDVFHFKRIIFLNSDDPHQKVYFEKLIAVDYQNDYSTFYRHVPQSAVYLQQLQAFGLQDNIVFQDTNTGENLVKEFVEYIMAAYKIKVPMVKNRILIAERVHCRKIINMSKLVKQLRAHGYDVVVSNFEKISIKEQILQTAQAEYLIGTYGSNLVNGIFLRPEANVVVLWHKYAKYFWSRRYCIIHSAFLSKGVKLIEFDKNDYDTRDVYTENIHDPDYFYRKDSRNYLRPEKCNLDAMIKYPLPAMYELTNVDLYIDPTQLIELLEQAKHLHNQPCQIGR